MGYDHELALYEIKFPILILKVHATVSDLPVHMMITNRFVRLYNNPQRVPKQHPQLKKLRLVDCQERAQPTPLDQREVRLRGKKLPLN